MFAAAVAVAAAALRCRSDTLTARQAAIVSSAHQLAHSHQAISQIVLTSICFFHINRERQHTNLKCGTKCVEQRGVLSQSGMIDWNRRRQLVRREAHQRIVRRQLRIRIASRQHLEHRDRKRPDVALDGVSALVESALANRLGRAPLCRRRLVEHHCVVESDREAEIAETRREVAIEKHVARRNVAMNDVKRMNMRKSRNQCSLSKKR